MHKSWNFLSEAHSCYALLCIDYFFLDFFFFKVTQAKIKSYLVGDKSLYIEINNFASRKN